MDGFQSGKTQAIDLDEMRAEVANRRGLGAGGEHPMDAWGDDPWAQPTEEEKQKRRWAEDRGWAGDAQEDELRNDPVKKWEGDKSNTGWNAPKRGEQSMTDGWDDWSSHGGGPLKLDEEDETKDNGGRRKLQAASCYEQNNSSVAYGEGRSMHGGSDDGYGTAGISEGRGDPYANMNSTSQEDPSMSSMKPVNEWDMNDVPARGGSGSEGSMVENANQNKGGEDIPGKTRASIIIFQAQGAPVVYELKKVSTTIGRGLDNMVILNDPFASRHHLVIKYVNGLFEAFCLSEDNIACCNKYPFSHIRLINNDQIELGGTRVKFVLGQITDAMMKLKAPKNGCPMHLSEPPAAVRSASITKKNVIILFGVAAAFLLFSIIGLVLMSSSRSAAQAEAQAKLQEEQDRAKAEEQAAREAEENAKVSLTDDELKIIDGMFEAYRAVSMDYHASDARLAGDKVKIKIDSTPSGARIYNADGSFRGVTPYDSVERIEGSRDEKWTLRLDGYDDTKVDVTIKKAMEPVNVEMEKGGAKPSAVAAAAPAPTPAPAAAPASKPATPKATSKPSGSKSSGSKSSGSKSSGGKKPGGRKILL